MIYFVACPEANAVKIGITGGPNVTYSLFKRLSMIQGGCPLRLELAGVQDGDLSAEKALHRQFAHAHIHGEWFRIVPEIQAHMLTLKHVEKPVRAARWEKISRQWSAAA